MSRLGDGEILARVVFRASVAGPLRPSVRQVGGIVLGTPVVRPLLNGPDGVVALVELPFDLYPDHELRSVELGVSVRGAHVLSTWPGPGTAPGETVGVGDDLTLRPAGSLASSPYRAQLTGWTTEHAGEGARWSAGHDTRALPADGHRLLLVVELPAGTGTVEGHLLAGATILQRDGTRTAATPTPEIRFSVSLRPSEPVAPAEPPRDRSPIATRGRGGPGGERDETATTLEPARPRHLHARIPDRVETGRPLSLLVAVTLAHRDGAARLKDLIVPPEGVDLTVLVSAPGLVLPGEREATIHVPADADSEPHRFALTAGPVGLHAVTVEAFHGGTYLGAASLQVSVERNVGAARENVQVAELPTVATEPGEVTLQVRRDADDVYHFQMLGDPRYAEVRTHLRDVNTQVGQLAAALRDMAAKKSPFSNPRADRERLRNLGIGLWQKALPRTVQDQFWEQAGRIDTFTVAAENDAIPWELLYPLSESSDDKGFLAEQIPLVRRVLGAPRTMQLGLRSAAYVVPPGSPTNAMEEVAAIRQRLGPDVVDRGVFSELDAMVGLVLDSPGVLHFACHNKFTDTEGSSIMLDGGPWAPVDLSYAGVRRSMAATSPLVFLNACRSAGEANWFSGMSGWARGFVEAGAGAFVGTLWAVRSRSACTFAKAFYKELVDERQALGKAALHARKAARDDGDPTWLAYTVYGNPAAARAVAPIERVIP